MAFLHNFTHPLTFAAGEFAGRRVDIVGSAGNFRGRIDLVPEVEVHIEGVSGWSWVRADQLVFMCPTARAEVPVWWWTYLQHQCTRSCFPSPARTGAGRRLRQLMRA